MKLQVIRQRSIWWTVSTVILITGLIAMFISWQRIGSPLRPSLDFIGGTRLQFELDCTQPNSCTQPIQLGTVRSVLDAQGLDNSSIQVVGKEGRALSIRTKDLDVDQRTKLQSSLSEKLGAFDARKTQIDTVGPTIGRQLFSSGMLALLLSFAGIVVYLNFRFQLDYAVFAIVALFHDVFVAIAAFAVFGLVYGTEVDSLFIVALLTIVGFSVNDTVVIYDRIRETLVLHPGQHINDVVDDAVNQTLTRSVNTTLTVLLTLFAIFLFSVGSLRDFALALIIGFACGAYSSVFIASTLLAWWRVQTGKAVIPATETAEVAPSSEQG